MAHSWRVVAFLWFAYFLNYVDRQVAFSIFPALQRDLAFTATQLGLVGSVFIWIYSVCAWMGGGLADRMRRDWLVAASLVLWSLTTLGSAYSASPEQFLFWRGAMGVTEGLYFPAAVALIGSVHGEGTRSRAIAMHGFAQFAGAAFGGWFGGYAADHWTWRAGYRYLAIAGVAYAPLLLWGLRGADRAAVESRARGGGLRAIVSSRPFLALSFAFLSVCVLLWMIYAWLPSFIYQRHRLSMTDAGFTATVWLQAGSAIGILCGGWIGDRAAGRRRGGRFFVIGTALLIAGPFGYFTFAGSTLLAMKCAAAAFGFFASIMLANNIAAAYDVTPAASRGLVAGLLTLVGGMAGGVGIFAAGRWQESIGVANLMACGAVIAMIAAAVLIGVTRKVPGHGGK